MTSGLPAKDATAIRQFCMFYAVQSMWHSQPLPQKSMVPVKTSWQGRLRKVSRGLFEEGRCFLRPGFPLVCIRVEFLESALWRLLRTERSLGITRSPWDGDSEGHGFEPSSTSHRLRDFWTLGTAAVKWEWHPLHRRAAERMPFEHWTRPCVHRTCPGKSILRNVGCWSHHKASYPIFL